MRKPVFPRILGLFVLYFVVFIVLVMIQFTKKGNFTRRIGGMVVSGRYLLSDDSAEKTVSGDSLSPDDSRASQERPPQVPAELPAAEVFTLAEGANIYFGGLEFNLLNRDSNENFVLIDQAGQRAAAFAGKVCLSKDSASFTLADGTELIFQTQLNGGAHELWINGIFSSGVSGVDIPVKLQRSSIIRETGDGHINILSDGSAYQFNRPVELRERTVLSLYAGAASVSYRAIPARKVFNPSDYVIANAQNQQVFNNAIEQWKEQKFSYWNSHISVLTDEDTVSAFCSESVNRGNYREAVASISPAFLENSQRKYSASVFVGGMTTALRTFIQAEREQINRISHLINEKSPDILIENHAFEFLLVRGYLNNAEDGLELIRSMDPALLTLDMCPGIFEGSNDIRQFRPNSDNPFERFTDQACNMFSGGVRIWAEKDQVFIFRGTTADIEYNLRLAKALFTWARAAGKNDWAALGYSLMLSVLSLQDNTGAVPAFVYVTESGGFSGAADNKLSAGKIYRIIGPGENNPRAAVIGSGVSGLWAWTAASAVNAAQENNVLDIAASFPTGETHYMMIRGVRPFSKIQIYNMDYPTDWQFERYDSSGWVYSAQDQILTVKLKHRGPVEHIKIFY